MDEELIALLDQARGAGASETQLQGIVDLYQKKKSLSGIASSNGETVNSPDLQAPAADGIPESIRAPRSSSAPADITSTLDQGAASIANAPFVSPSTVTQPQNPTNEPNTPGYTAGSLLSHFNNAVLGGAAKAGSFLSAVASKINDGDVAHGPAYDAYIKANPDQANPESLGEKFFNWASDYLEKDATKNPLPDTFVGKTTGGLLDAAGIVIGAAATGGENIEAKAATYLGKSQIVQQAITKAAGPLTQYLATTTGLSKAGEAFRSNGRELTPALAAGAEGFVEGAKSGVSLELAMAAGGQIGGGIFKQMVKAGLATEDGVLTEQALKSFIGSPSAFAAQSVADDVANGRPIDWKNAGVAAATALPFEVPHVFEAYKRAGDINDTKKTIDKAINEAIQVRDNNAIINFTSADPGDILQAMQRPETSQELQVQALEKGVTAQDAKTVNDKNTLHAQQVELQTQSDIKRYGETVIDHGVDGFIQAVGHTDLPEDTKTLLLNKANAINQVFNPVEVKKTEIGKTVDDLDSQIKDIHQQTFNGRDQTNISSDNLVKLNDLIGQKVQAQTDLFNLSYGTQEQAKKSVAVANAVAENLVTEPNTNLPPKTIIPVNSEFVNGHITDVNDNGDATLLESDGTSQQISTGRDQRALGITDDHIQQFRDANKATEQFVDNGDGKTIPVTPQAPIDGTDPHEGETEFEHKVRTTNDPGELANMYNDKIKELDDQGGMEHAIASYGPKVSPANFNEHNDKNNVTPGISQHYFVKKSERALGIDVQAQEINDQHFNGTDHVQPSDITDFMVKYPGGKDTYSSPKGNKELTAINNRYKEITGKRLRKDIAAKLADKYNVSKRLANQAAEVVNEPVNHEVLQERISDLMHREGIFTGMPDYDKIGAEFERYINEPKNEFNAWHTVFGGKEPNEHDVELIKKLIDGKRESQRIGDRTGEGPATGGDDSAAKPAAQDTGGSGPDAERSGEGKGQKEIEPPKYRTLDDIKVGDTVPLGNGTGNLGEVLDIKVNKNGGADIIVENENGSEQSFTIGPKERQSYEDQLNEGIERPDAANINSSSERIDKATQAIVKEAMDKVFPNIKTKYYDNVDDFNKAASETSLKKVIENGDTLHAFVDKDRVIHFNPDFLKKDTQMHEQGHILVNWAQHYAPKLYERMMAVGRAMGDEQSRLKDNGYDLKGQKLIEEAFVSALGKEGAKNLDEVIKGKSQRSALQGFINEAWTKLERWIANKTGFSVSKFKNIKDMTIDDFTKYVNEKYLSSGVKISDISSEDLAAKNYTKFDEAQQSPKPERMPGEKLGDFAQRIADWMDENDRQANEARQTPPGNIVGGTNATTVLGDSDWDLPKETRKEKITRTTQDYMNRAKKAQEQIKKAGGTIGVNEDYYNHQRRVAALAEHQIDKVHEDIFKSADKKKPALFEQMKKKGISETDLGLYLYAKHAEERNRENASSRQVAFNAEHDRVKKRLQDAIDRKDKKTETYFKNKLDILDQNQSTKYPLMADGGSGMTNQQAKDILNDFDAKGKTDVMEDLAKQYKEKVTDKQLQYDLDSGRISQEDFDTLKEKYKNYVPLQVRDHVEAKNAGTTLSKLIRVKDAFQRAKGAVARDFNQRINPLSYGIVQLEKSIIEGEKNKLLNTFRNLAEQNPNEAVWDVIQPRYKVTYKADGSVDKVDNITDQKIKDNSLYGFADGKPFYLHIKDDILKRAVKKEAFDMGDGGVAKVLQVVNNVSGFVRNGLTVYNPSFWVPNFVKDNFSAQFNLGAQESKGLVTKFEKNIPTAMNGVIQYERGNRDHPDSKVYESYLENGGKLTYSRYDLDIDKLQHITDYFKNADKASLNPATWVPKLGEYMNRASELFELTTRVAAYKAAIDSGVPPHEAAVLSKESTVDFSQKGEWSPLFNSLYLFSNAGVQGANTFFKNIGKNPAAAGKIIGGAIASGILAAAFNAQTNGTPNPNGENDDQDYYRLNDNEKQGNLIIRNVLGHGFIKIPLGHELGVFPYIGDKIYNYITGHNEGPATSKDIFNYVLSAYSPVGGSDAAQFVAPTILDPFVQVGENKNSFGNPIYKKTDDNATLPQSQSHFTTTEPFYVQISDKAHKLTGGTGAKNGLIEVPPDAIPWAIQTAFGGAGKTLAQAVDLTANSIQLKPTEIKNIPVLYRFYTHGNDKNYRSNVIGLLDKSGTENVTPREITMFNQEAMKAVLKHEIDDKQYEKYMNTFQRNIQRIKLSERFPDKTPDELKQMMQP